MIKIQKSRKMIVVGSIILVLAALLTVKAFSAGRNGSALITGYTELTRSELVNSVSVSGTVESYQAQNVYSILNYPIKEIYVSVGDSVKAGDVLAQLDTASLALDIAQQRSTLTNSEKNAEIDLENKRRTYENAKYQYENGINTELVNAENSLKTAEADLQTKHSTYENNKALYESGFVSQQELDQSETNYRLAKANYDKAVATLKTTKIKVEQDLKTAEASLKSAEANYHNNSQKITLQKLEKNLKDSTIRSPINGTVTAVYAAVGSPGNGLLFVIEDTENLMITTYVKEYDAGKIYAGQRVNIKSDATGARVLNGEVVKISPASVKNASGATITSSTVEFETEIAITEHDPDLKIGMNTRLNIILEKKTGVYAVPYDALTVNSDGQSIIYIIAEENGKQIVKEQIVKKGMETDLYTEISGDGLAEGTRVVNDAASVKSGDVVKLQTTK